MERPDTPVRHRYRRRAPPYGNSHRLIANAGHTDFLPARELQAVCNYVFGVPPENQAGTPR